MARYGSGVLTAAGTTTLPIISLFAAAAVGGKIREVGLTNTTATAVAQALKRYTTVGGTHNALVEAKDDPDSAAAGCTAFSTDTGTTPTGRETIWASVLRWVLRSGPASFGRSGIPAFAPVGTANGIGVAPENGTGQAMQAYMKWDE